MLATLFRSWSRCVDFEPRGKENRRAVFGSVFRIFQNPGPGCGILFKIFWKRMLGSGAEKCRLRTPNTYMYIYLSWMKGRAGRVSWIGYITIRLLYAEKRRRGVCYSVRYKVRFYVCLYNIIIDYNQAYAYQIAVYTARFFEVVVVVAVVAYNQTSAKFITSFAH